jgi:glycosyltransferase involved in cell wall biosynthesis
MLKRHHPDVPIVLVGGTFPSPDCLTEKEIEAVRDAGVEMTGAVDDVRPALRDCSVFVLPSYREGTPRTALEALSVGRAIVTTDVPGCRETVVEGENGFLVPPRDPKSLYEAMLRFVEKPGLAAAMGAVSRQIAEEKFDVRKINNRMIELLEL